MPFQELECAVSVEEDNRQEWTFTLYDFDNNGKVTREVIIFGSAQSGEITSDQWVTRRESKHDKKDEEYTQTPSDIPSRERERHIIKATFILARLRLNKGLKRSLIIMQEFLESEQKRR